MGPAVLLAEGSGPDPSGAGAVQTAEPAGHQRDGHGAAAVPPPPAPALGLGPGKRAGPWAIQNESVRTNQSPR